jgi:hypothetical protein
MGRTQFLLCLLSLELIVQNSQRFAPLFERCFFGFSRERKDELWEGFKRAPFEFLNRMPKLSMEYSLCDHSTPQEQEKWAAKMAESEVLPPSFSHSKCNLPGSNRDQWQMEMYFRQEVTLLLMAIAVDLGRFVPVTCVLSETEGASKKLAQVVELVNPASAASSSTD